MSIIVLLTTVVLTFNSWGAVESGPVNRTYLIKKDFVSGLKGGEFTIYDSTGKKQLFRMETKFGLTHDVRFFPGKSKKDVLARMKAKVTLAMYKATMTILDARTNSWNNGTVQQNFKAVGSKFQLEFGGRHVVMEGKPFSLDTTFVDSADNSVLAKFHKRVTSLFWRNKYDLQVLSDKLPEAVYFLGIAARDHK